MVNSLLKYTLLAIGAAFVIGLAYFLTRETSKRLYKKAVSLHRQGELYYLDGDSELADEYYREAELLRDKARGLS